MDLTKDERIFLRELAIGRERFLSPGHVRLEEMEEAGFLRRVGGRPLDVAITGEGRKKAEQL